MGLFNFGKKKKKPSKLCELEGSLLEYGEGYLLTSSQIIASKRFWDNKMLEPETLAYSKAHFEKNDKTGTQMRGMIFEKYATKEKAWLIGDGQINLFEVDKEKAKAYALQWWDSGFTFLPPQAGPAQEILEGSEFEKWKKYSIMEAGQAQLLQMN